MTKYTFGNSEPEEKINYESLALRNVSESALKESSKTVKYGRIANCFMAAASVACLAALSQASFRGTILAAAAVAAIGITARTTWETIQARKQVKRSMTALAYIGIDPYKNHCVATRHSSKDVIWGAERWIPEETTEESKKQIIRMAKRELFKASKAAKCTNGLEEATAPQRVKECIEVLKTSGLSDADIRKVRAKRDDLGLIYGS